jgi:hypothetical protein
MLFYLVIQPTARQLGEFVDIYDTVNISSLYGVELLDDRWIKKDFEGRYHGLIEELKLICLWGLRKTTKHSVSIAGVWAEIYAEYLPNASLECYRCTNPKYWNRSYQQ